MQKNLALIAKYIKNIYIPTNNNLITSSNTRNKNVDTSPRTRNNSQAGKFMNQRTITIAGARETVDMCDNEEEDDHYADAHEDERVALANLKLGTNENKKIQKHLRKPNVTLTHELNECKSALEESNDIQDRCRSALHDREIELEKYKKFKNCQLEKEEVEHNRLNKPITHEITVLVKNLLMPLAIKTKANANEFERAFKQEMFEDLEYVQSLGKEVDELESEQADFSNEYDLLLQEFVSKDIMCAILRSFDNLDEYYEMA
ncbi:hypothetical protein Tco_0670750 [Tanacetum coccineum]